MKAGERLHTQDSEVLSHIHTCKHEGSKELFHIHIYANMKAAKSIPKYTGTYMKC